MRDRRSTMEQGLDARILLLILKGQLQPTSMISDGVGEPALLQDHERFSHVLRLARVGTSISALRNVGWWNAREPTWSADIAIDSVWKSYFRASREHLTGFMTLTRGSVSKVVAFASGAPVCVSSNLKREQLGALLVERGDLTEEAADQAAQLGRKEKQLMGWALLKLGFAEPPALLATLEVQAQQRLLETISWTEGEIRFHADQRAAQLYHLVNLPLLDALRRGIWSKHILQKEQLEHITEALLERSESLRLAGELGTLQYELNDAEAALIGWVKEAKPANTVRGLLEALGENHYLDGLRGVYLFAQLGIIELEAAEYAQPVLLDLDDPALSDELAALRAQRITTPFESAPADGSGPELAAPAASAATLAAMAAKSSSAAPPLQATAPSDNVGSSSLDEYRVQLQLQEEGRRLLNSHQYAEAVKKFEILTKRQEKPVDAYAYLSLATLLAKGLDFRRAALKLAEKAFDIDETSALARVAMARALKANGKRGPASEHRLYALDMGASSEAWLNEIKLLLRLGLEGVAAEKVPADWWARGAWTLAVSVLVGLFVGSNILRRGVHEYVYSGTDPFFYVRRIGLIVGGVACIWLITRVSWRQIIKEVGWQGDFLLIITGVLWGLFVGWLSPYQRVTTAVYILLPLSLLHVLAEEIFFRGFITRALLKKFGGEQETIFLSALIYGIYHITFYSFWHESLLWPRFYWCASIAMLAGIPYAWLYVRTRSVLVPMVCHASVSMFMMLRSLYFAG